MSASRPFRPFTGLDAVPESDGVDAPDGIEVPKWRC
jgi:hypothetical protein